MKTSINGHRTSTGGNSENEGMRNILLCPDIFFSLPTQEFFHGQGKIKVGTGTEKMKPNSSKITDGRRSASLQLNDAIR